MPRTQCFQQLTFLKDPTDLMDNGKLCEAVFDDPKTIINS